MRTIVKRIFELASRAAKTARHVVFELLRPRPSITTGLASDAFRFRLTLLAENALLRQQLIVAERHVKKPMLHRHERAFMVGLAAITKGWQNAVLLVKPETVLRWHRKGFRCSGATNRRRSHVSRASRWKPSS